MSAPQRTVVHVHRLSPATRLLLAAAVIALLLNALAPFLQGGETRAQGTMPLGLQSLSCEGVLPGHGETLQLECAGASL